ncbi:MAG: hypothetical protein IID39_00520 [Planctomycetes bacterium]|nr:hypothetical protein [Planctomycetota bacterium]
MPLQVTTSELSSGMRLHQAVYDGPRLLLPAGKELNSADADYLRHRRPGASVFIEDPVLDELVAFEDERRNWHVARAARAALVNRLSGVQERFASRMSLKAVDCRGVEEAVAGVLSFLQENPVTAATLLEPKDDEHYLVTHSAHVFYLSIVIGTAVRAQVARSRSTQLARHDVRPIVELNLTPLGLAALFMDAGMWPIIYLYDRSEPLTDEQCELVRQHPLVGAGMLPAEIPDVIKVVVSTHHENIDGSGYPYALKGDEIHLFARILRIADAYAAATSTTGYRDACSPPRALWEMTLGPFAELFDPVLLKVFAQLIHPFPIGAKLRLSCGRYGVVVRYGNVSPFHPQVIIAFDENGDRLPEHLLEGPIELHERDDLTIVSFAGEDLTDLYTSDPDAFSIAPSEFTTLYESAYTGCALPATPSL